MNRQRGFGLEYVITSFTQFGNGGCGRHCRRVALLHSFNIFFVCHLRYIRYMFVY